MMMLQTSIRRTLPTLTARRTLSTYKFNNLFDSNHLDLPRLPIPNLKDTLSRYESSLRPLCENEEELKNSQQAISTFLNNGGEDLHLKLCSIDEQYKSSGQFPHFYFEDLWDDGYLSARCPNPVHINPTFFMPTKPSTKSNSQEAIASEFLSASARWLVHARAGGLASDGLDMSRLGRVMGTARIPEMDTDSLQYYGDKSNHIVVQINNGEFYRVDILTADGKQALSPQAIEDALSQIKAYSANSDALKDDHPGVGVLTSLPRSDWASARSKLINTDVTGTNEKTLQTIDSALLVVSLDQLDTAGDVTEYCRANLHGVNQQTRSDKWWDKIQLLVDPQGRVGLQFEHSFSDGLCWNRWLGEIWHAMGQMDTPSKWVYGHLPSSSKETNYSLPVTQLEFRIDDSLKQVLYQADQKLENDLQNGVDTLASTFDGFGKNEIKNMGYSPDAFVQMSYQLAYSKLHGGNPAATYEACSTARYFHGRTETIRSCSEEARSFVNGCLNVNLSKEERVKLFAAATEQQSTLSRNAAGGLGVDRHLMALGALARKNGMEKDENIMNLFNDPLYTRSSTWTLSTSNVAAPWLSNFGFGPTAMDGFGLGYQILNDSVPIHVTSWNSSNVSVSSKEMFNGITEAMDEMKSLHQ